MFCEKGVRTNFANSQENACARVSFLIKLQDQAWNIIKKETLAQVFPVNFAKCLRTVFITEQNIWVSINHSMFGTAWKVFALGVIPVRIFPHSDENNSEYGDSLRNSDHIVDKPNILYFFIFLSVLSMAFIDLNECSFLLVNDYATVDMDVFLKSGSHLPKMLGLFASTEAF